ncbi:hypothetical protein CPB83DRAFT_908203 [Crepidotus variabilis]|uniref:Uncharacterized protein n=1 Tax=Crepidotus variabilis TaxID=179855 RepID=A0A9P6JNK0_9AGAR|nr:hypothetical protein CPB83DRAFT_908203 [Crepidotus variabilis]
MPDLNDLPLEIIDRFLEDLAELFDVRKPGQKQAQKRNLRSCSEASRAFHVRTLRFLFKDIVFIVKPGEITSRSSKSLHELLDPSNDPLLATYIRSFTIEISTRSGEKMHPLQDHHLPDILTWCGNIKILSLEVLYGRCGWNQISEEIKTAFLSLRGKPHLDTLRFSGFGLEVPIDVILQWTGLKRLIIRAAPIAHIIPSKRIKHLPKIEVDTLDLITNFSTNLTFLITSSSLPLATLKHLNATIYGGNDWISIWKLFLETRETLETLAIINLFTTTHRSEVAAALTPQFSFTNLRSISISETHSDKMNSIIDLLVMMSSSPKLESVRMDLRWEILDEYRVVGLSSELEAMKKSWDKLDRTLALKSCMRNLEFILQFAFPTPRTKHDWGSKLEGFRANWNPASIFPLLTEKECVQTQLLWTYEISDA